MPADHSTPEGRRCPECGGVTEPPTEIEAREGVRFCPRCQLYAPPAPEGGVPMVWRDCSPELLAAGVNCANTPRRPGLTPDVSHQHLVPVPTPTSAEGGEDDPVLCPRCGQEAMYVLAPEERRGQYVCNSPHCEGGYFTHVAPTLAATGGEEGLSPETLSEMHRAFLDLLKRRDIVSIGTQPEYATEMFHVVTAPLRRQLAEAEATMQARAVARLALEAEHEAEVAALTERATTAERRLEEVGQYLSVREREGVLPAIMEVTTKLAAFREALTFYGTVANWHTTSRGFAAQYDPVPSPINADFGAKAREALSSLSSPHQSTGQGA